MKALRSATQSLSRKMRATRILALGVIALGVGLGTANAATILDENFNANTQPGSMLTSGSGVSFNSGSVAFNGGRSYLRTTQSDFFNFDFVAEVTLSTGGDISFFGMGAGTPAAPWSEPDGASINLRLHPSSIAGGRSDAVGATLVPYAFTQFNTFGYLGSNSAQRLRLTWDATTKQAQFAIDNSYNGTFVADAMSALIDGSSLGLNGTNSSIFFGGAGNARYDNFVITSSAPVATPDSAATFGLILAGLVSLAVWKRQS